MDKSRINTEREDKDELTQENTAASPEAEDAPAQPENREVVRLQEEVAEMKDKYLRLYSEFENYKRRTAKEKRDMIDGANEQLLQSLLPVADDFQRAEKALQVNPAQDVEGFRLIQNKFMKILELYGVKLMDISPGSDFDTDRHEAISQVPTAEDGMKGKIVNVIENGYLLKDKVIRFAKVVVAG